MTEKNKFGQIIGKEVKNWQGAKKPPSLIIQGKYCILEPLNIKKHSVELFNQDYQDESWTYLSAGPFNNLNEFQNHLQELIARDDALPYAILDINHQAIGIAAYLRIDHKQGTIEVGHLHFSKLLQRTRGSTEAMYLMMRQIFEELGYRRYEWKCNSLNQSSIEAAKRLGFTFEGIFRQSNVVKGRNRDTAWFSIIDSQWPEIKLRLLKWLDPNNFDQNGNQILSLRKI